MKLFEIFSTWVERLSCLRNKNNLRFLGCLRCVGCRKKFLDWRDA